MLNKSHLLLLLLILTSCFGSKDNAINNFSFSDESLRQEDKIAYALGRKYAASINDFDLDEQAFKYLMRGLEDGVKVDGKLSSDINFYARKIDVIVQAKRAQVAEESKSKGKSFVENLLKKDSSYQQTDSGLVYKVIKMGKVKKFTKDSFVEMRYQSFYLNDKEYESTMTGNPRKLPLKGIFPAWTEAFSICGEGCEIEVIAPPALTYGDNGALPYIQPGEYLKYKINFLKLVK